MIESNNIKLSFTNFNNNSNNNSNNNDSDSENENESEHESESENVNEKDKYYHEIRQLNNQFETIDQTKPLEEQLKLLKERGEFLSQYWCVDYYHGNKELTYKILKAKVAYLLNDLVTNLQH